MSTLTTWYNPFTNHGNDNLLNISSGAVATESTTGDLLNACMFLGEESFRDFITDRISQPTTDPFKPIKKLNPSTFSSLVVKSLVNTNSGKQK